MYRYEVSWKDDDERFYHSSKCLGYAKRDKRFKGFEKNDTPLKISEPHSPRVYSVPGMSLLLLKTDIDNPRDPKCQFVYHVDDTLAVLCLTN